MLERISGVARKVPMTNGGIFTIGLLSMIIAAGVTTRVLFSGVTIKAPAVEGGDSDAAKEGRSGKGGDGGRIEGENRSDDEMDRRASANGHAGLREPIVVSAAESR